MNEPFPERRRLLAENERMRLALGQYEERRATRSKFTNQQLEYFATRSGFIWPVPELAAELLRLREAAQRRKEGGDEETTPARRT